MFDFYEIRFEMQIILHIWVFAHLSCNVKKFSENRRKSFQRALNQIYLSAYKLSDWGACPKLEEY